MRTGTTHHHAKFYRNSLNDCRDMTVSNITKWCLFANLMF